ncbi:transmembrane protein, putative, partial [Rhizoctonia solani AG-3 Rhs1AP]
MVVHTRSPTQGCTDLGGRFTCVQNSAVLFVVLIPIHLIIVVLLFSLPHMLLGFTTHKPTFNCQALPVCGQLFSQRRGVGTCEPGFKNFLFNLAHLGLCLLKGADQLQVKRSDQVPSHLAPVFTRMLKNELKLLELRSPRQVIIPPESECMCDGPPGEGA